MKPEDIYKKRGTVNFYHTEDVLSALYAMVKNAGKTPCVQRGSIEESFCLRHGITYNIFEAEK